ncbi:hypothetical protein PC119_g4144 [Phytophthora cactorum]|uniref:FYVE-type domain-containing protein n=1 Tax=Phytophthora cactorum TaxID=29920 RepID=A0A8T1E8Z8_9STRA|nr:hypothetical protein PC115_g8068 [Phytophthora cactorum]KAG2948758.1 hypothetical protein PC117_g5797 [Phytophthora cactorum]KAG3036773.1 hypothetical protein PC119_g4144 [Phytophthora cactorum]KAG3199294.1 hypothetical protein PC128_g5392 [Phytophthora cactorum]
MRIHHRPAKSPEFKSPFAPLHLAVEDEAQLEAVARMFVQNTVVQYEKFIEQGRRKRQPPMQQMMGFISHQNSLASLTRSLPPQKARHGSLTVTVPAAAAAATTVTDTKLCVTCKKRGPWFSTHGKKKKPATTCQLCWRYVCSSCRLKKTVMNCVTDPRRDDRLSTHVVQREVTLCNVCVHQSMVATSARDVAREEIEADPKRWRFPSPTHTRERSSDGYLQAHLLSQLNASTHGTSALRPVSIVSLRSEHAVNDLFQRCA